jgi:hypothetical protein
MTLLLSRWCEISIDRWSCPPVARWLRGEEAVARWAVTSGMANDVRIGVLGSLVVAGGDAPVARQQRLLLLALAAQVTLGISTLLLHVPVSVAAAHQGGAMLLLTAMLFVSYTLVCSDNP